MMDQISVDTLCDVPELRLIVSEGDANSAELDTLSFYFSKLKLPEVKTIHKI